ncbi:class I SAM-dependent methyltransferase [Nocardioides gansuensis]|uniref:class I SAM-dependent methyltransferase n=1 Tax=Nocardioides gansuensis TaxID=2138300 RepID=UPI001401D943|nr:class I SAM-dependent methyltransferase [Nocardioides gansuensis]
MLGSRKVAGQDRDIQLGRDMIGGEADVMSPALLHYLDVFVEFVRQHADGGTLLDLGCGDGGIARLVAERSPHLKITAMDVEEHPAWADEHPDNLAFAVGSLEDLPFDAGSFDTVVVKDVLHHVDDPADALRSVRGLARSRVLLIEANRYNPISYIRMVKIAGHEHFSRRRLRQIVGEAFELTSVETHVWPGRLGKPGRGVDRLFNRWRIFTRLRSYNICVVPPLGD